MEVWAHRGFSAQYPENTLVAFAAALQAGADGIELDVHLTADGELAVIHDHDVSRTTDGRGVIEWMRWAELRRLDAGGWFHPRFRGERIPSLAEVLALVQRHPRPVAVNIELKTAALRGDALAQRVWQVVVQHGMAERVWISSFNHLALAALKARHPEARIAPLYMEALVEPWRYAQGFGAAAVHPEAVTLDEALVRDIHRAGLRVHVWTVNDAARLRELRDWGVDAVITDRPDIALALR
ncbi:glycerophosphoryl diester phosphodiesterase [Alicyclobacillus cellulosilyticus]|uniref:Glycerophosphoryl diester phosphodiesterase n=1 Tax=Alicyclobacillus cellulosilyticus TaxID=1003997 RepID=A0A917NI38_9BACL|nr:glycerophosphodiester phosphodiesterase family protein [Alicyclobacillus cellulosilyticus]GGJ02866.1 glycerophosphoryl diester phosphodiesterase [Alicyclobacillus cellulosilyticus]